MSRQLGTDYPDGTGKQELQVEVTRGSNGAVNDAAGGVVAPHRVYGDTDHEIGFRLLAELVEG
jgi:hypothetical protein